MKYIFNRLVVALLLVVLASAATFAKGHKATITLKSDTKVGEVLVKKGTYQVKFDEQANELSIWQGKKLIAKSAVELQPRPWFRSSLERSVVIDRPDPTLGCQTCWASCLSDNVTTQLAAVAAAPCAACLISAATALGCDT